MCFTTNLFVANLLKHLRSCQFTVFWFAPLKTSVKRQLSKLIITFFTDSLAIKATMHVGSSNFMQPNQICTEFDKLSNRSCLTVQAWEDYSTIINTLLHPILMRLIDNVIVAWHKVDNKVSQPPLITSIFRLTFYDLSTFQCQSTHYQPARHR